MLMFREAIVLSLHDQHLKCLVCLILNMKIVLSPHYIESVTSVFGWIKNSEILDFPKRNPKRCQAKQ